MAKGAYIGVQTSHTYTNMLGGIGDMETGTVYKTTAEAAYLKDSSQHKFGSSSQAFQQSGSATELAYTLRNSSGQMSFALDNTHQYYFSVWIRQNTSLDLSFDWYWPIAEPSVMSGVKNAALNTWEHHSAVVSRSGFTSGSYPMRIDCNNYPGNNALMYVDGLMVIDLTATYGAGNEPTKEFCDQYFAFTTGTNTVTIPTAREIKKMYIGVGGVARKVKKGYIGVGGVARPFWSTELAYYGTATGLNQFALELAATTVGNYALFGGGSYMSYPKYYTNVTTAYNNSLVKSTPTALNSSVSDLAATTVGNYALFGGGTMTNSNGIIGVSAYNKSLTRTNPTSLSYGRGNLAATTVGNYAIFDGGVFYYSVVCDVYDSSLTHTIGTTNALNRLGLAATTIGNYALFGGGFSPVSSNERTNAVEAYNTSLTLTTCSTLSASVGDLAATTVGNYALFGGGNPSGGSTGSGVTNTTAYNSSLVKVLPTNFTTGHFAPAATTLEDYAIFFGGHVSSSRGATQIFNSSLTLTALDIGVQGRQWLAATTVGNYALFGGGQDRSSADSYTNTVNVYTT